MPETAENVAVDWAVSRGDQDAFALGSQRKAAAAQRSGRLAREIVSVDVPQRKGPSRQFSQDEHPRATTADGLAALRPVVRPDGTVTAGDASGLNDGVAAMIVAAAAARNGLTPRARVVAVAASGVAPRVMGVGPIEAARRVLRRGGIGLDDLNVIEINEAFASQAVASLRALGVDPIGDERVNPNGGAIALGHPLGMSGARIVLSATEELQVRRGRWALAVMCVGVGQGAALLLERV